MLSIAALALTVTTTAFAEDNGQDDQNEALDQHMESHMGLGASMQDLFHHGEHDDNGLHLGQLKQNLSSSQFIVVGTVASTTDSSVTVNVQKQVNVSGIANGQVTVLVNSSTVLGDSQKDNDDDDSFTLSSLKPGDRVLVQGSISGSTLTATSIRLLQMKKSNVVFGSVSAVTPTSVTITNAKTGTSQTITTNSDTKVMVNGTAATTSDIQVGDHGFVRIVNDVTGFIAKLIAIFR